MAPKGAAVKKAVQPEEPVEIPAGVKLGFFAFVGALLAILFYVTRESALDFATRDLVKQFNLNNVAVELAYNAKGLPVLVAKQPIFQGQPVMGISSEVIIDVRTIGETAVGQLFRMDNGTAVNEAGKDNQLPPGAFTLMSFAAYFAHERRLGAESKLNSFFASLPAQIDSAIYWKADVLTCLDPNLGAEYKAQLRTVNATKQALAVLCDSAEGAAIGCQQNPFDEEELAWGMSVYLQHNFQDQAFIPLLSFAQFNNDQASAVTPQFDRESGNLLFISGVNLKRGEEVTLNFARGPQVYFAAFSKFQADARGVELQLQVPENEAARSLCPITELQFGAHGKPREGLVNCMTYLVASDEVRVKLAKNIRKYRTPELVAFAYGNLTYAANMLRDDKIDDAACDALATTPVIAAAREYNAWRRKVLDANRVHLEQTAVLKYQQAGLPLPSQSQQEAPAAAEEASADSTEGL